MRVALISSPTASASALRAALVRAGLSVQRYDDEAQLSHDAGRMQFDLLLVNGTGLIGHVSRPLCRLSGGGGFDAALIFFNCPDGEALLADAFAQGADDFIRQGAGFRELLARIDAVLRRRTRSHTLARQLALYVAPYAFDLDARIARIHGKVVPLTDREFDLAVLLFRNIGQLFTREHLLAAFWHGQRATRTRTVDTHVSRVRRRLMLDARHGFRLISAYGKGYRLERTREPRSAPARDADNAKPQASICPTIRATTSSTVSRVVSTSNAAMR